ncbi:MAG TPA: peptidylprolyl isomerase [Mariprofundaceae bacterium]|nr:peptidylprolyl isomerase [Mariprofundaceae bacterium]
MQIAKDKVVYFHYTLTNDAGEVLDSSEGAEPMAYLHGAANIIPGLEKALEGKSPGDSLKVTVEPAEGYGEIDEDLLQVVPSSLFQGVDALEVGMQFQAQTSEGVQVVTITKVDGDDITIDGNHPLAGERLHFDVQVDSVRDATAEELDHGHVHDGGHAHH